MQIHRISDDFWNIRAPFRIGGVINIGTQASLVRLGDGRFVMLDALGLDPGTLDAVRDHTGGAIAAILNLHPFHTVHTAAAHAAFPEAALYGTRRHHERFPDLPWAAERCEEPALHALFASDLAFSVPRGVDFIASNPNLHFASVLAYHRASRSLHVDDTIVYTRLPAPLRMVGLEGRVALHPTLAQTLQRRPGAAQDFRDWAAELIADWHDAENLCAAHTHALLGASGDGAPVMERVAAAVRRAERTLARHEKRHR